MSGVLLITGASTGIGASTARQAAEAGWKVVVSARSEDKLEELAGQIGGDVLAQRCDVTDFSDQERLVGAPIVRFRPIDALFPNPGFGAHPRLLLEAAPV